MKNDRFDDPLEALQAALDVGPSPDFATRVRTAVDRPARWSWTWTRAAVVVGACAAVGVAALYVRKGSVPLPSVPTIAETHAPEAPPSFDRAPSIVPAAGERQVSRTHVNRSPRAATRLVEPEVLVSGDQLLALRQLAAGLRDGRIDADNLPPSLVAPEQDAPDAGTAPGADLIRKIALASISAADSRP